MESFPIRVLSEKTGVAPTTLRAWERRYGLLKPQRTPKGHRLYNSNDVEAVNRIVNLLNENYTISKAINAIKLEEIQEKIETRSDPDKPNTDHWDEFHKRFLTAIEQFDEYKLDNIYNEALSLYPIDLVSSQILRPLLATLGQRWESRDAGIAEEHFFTSYLRNKVGARLHHISGKNQGRRILLACMPGEFHELGSLLFGLSAMSRGYRILFLGADLPLDQIHHVVETTEIDAVLLSAVNVTLRGQISRQLEKLAADLSVPVMLGGTGAMNIADLNDELVVVLGDDYRKALQVLEQTLPVH
jgi:MerR family transcriptional regulator, light-induced transcriptional regulator